MQPFQWIRGWNPLSVARFACANVKPHHFFNGFVSRRRDGVINCPKMLYDALHVHALVSIHKDNCAKQGPVLLQHGRISGIRHGEMIPLHNEEVVKHGHGAPHIRIIAIHFVKIFMHYELTARGIGEMV